MKRTIITLLVVSCIFIVAVLAASILHWPMADGLLTDGNNKLSVDISHTDQGYFMAKGQEGSKRYKLRVEVDGQMFTYDINNKGEYEIFPLQMGSGYYSVTLYQNAEGNKYATAGSVSIRAEVENEYGAFLIPNQYVAYDQSTKAVALSDELCDGLTSDKDKFNAIHDYLRSNLMYDYVKAYTVQPGSMPDIDGCLDKRMGICQDIAATAACMLRVQGIPTKMIIGYCGTQYHAWNVVVIDGEEVFMDLTAEICGSPPNTYSVERFY